MTAVVVGFAIVVSRHAFVARREVASGEGEGVAPSASEPCLRPYGRPLGLDGNASHLLPTPFYIASTMQPRKANSRRGANINPNVPR